MKKNLFILLCLCIGLGNLSAQQWEQVGANILGETANETLGASTSINAEGDIVAIGAPHSTKYGIGFSNPNPYGPQGLGFAKVMKNIDGEWVQLGQELHAEGENGIHFGYSVSLNDEGNILAVGAKGSKIYDGSPGAVRIFSFDGTSWNQLGADIFIPYPSNNFYLLSEPGIITWNRTVKLSADGYTVAVSNVFDNYSEGWFSYYNGSVSIYNYIDGEWVQKGQKIQGIPQGSPNNFARSISLNDDGSIVAVGAPYQDIEGVTWRGLAKAYQFVEGSWVQLGQELYGDEGRPSSFGISVDLNSEGSRLVVGAMNHDVNGNNSGQVKIFQLVDNTWELLGPPINGEAGSFLGLNTELNDEGNIVALANTGQTQIYKLINNSWEQQGQIIYGASEGDYSGMAINLNKAGNKFVVGSHNHDALGYIVDAGMARVFEWTVDVTEIEVAAAEGGSTTVCSDVEMIQLEAVLTPEDTTFPEVIWTVEAGTEYVSVDENGLVTIIAAGTAVVRATSADNTEIFGDIVITINPLPVLEIESTEFVFCSGAPVELFATSPGNVIFWYTHQDDDEYTYHGNLFTPEITESTTYWVEAYNISTGCVSERMEITITINPTPDAPIAVEVQYFEEGATLADIEVDASGDLTWYADAALTIVLPETTLIEENTTYYVTQTIEGCESEATIINPEFLGSFDINDSGFTVYPNPTAGIVKIQSKVAVSNIEVFNMNGQAVTSVKRANEVNLSGYSSGTYEIRITLENGEILTRKVIKK